MKKNPVCADCGKEIIDEDNVIGIRPPPYGGPYQYIHVNCVEDPLADMLHTLEKKIIR